MKLRYANIAVWTGCIVFSGVCWMGLIWGLIKLMEKIA